MVLGFIDYVLSHKTHCQYLSEKMAQYETLNFNAKIKMISHLLDQMFEEQGLDTESEECNRKRYLNILACKTMLIFPLHMVPPGLFLTDLRRLWSVFFQTFRK